MAFCAKVGVDVVKYVAACASLLLVLVMLLSVFVGCVDKDINEIVTITYVAVGQKPHNADEIISRVNERMRKEIGIEVKVKFVSKEKNKTLYEGNEYFDSIMTAEHLGYWQNAANGCYATISMDELKKYAPKLSKVSKDVFEAAEYEGKIYAIPSLTTKYNLNCWVARGDLMDKYGITAINDLDDIESYLKAVKENEPDIVPFNICAEEAYSILASMTINNKWENPGPSNALSPIQISTDPEDENYLKVFNALDTPEMLEFTERMKKWREWGFWPETALETQIPACESIIGGRSAIAWMSLLDFEQIKKICSVDSRKDWDLRAFYSYSKNPITYSRMTSATAISSKSTKKADTLRMLDFLYSDQECYRLMNYGIENENYELVDGKFRSIDAFNVKSASFGISNANLSFKPYFEDKHVEKTYDEIITVVKNDEIHSKIKNFAPKFPIEDGRDALINRICKEYTIPRILGFVDDAQEALRIEMEMFTNAGIESYAQDVQMQLDKYALENGLK